MAGFIGLSVPNIKGNELKYVTEALEAEWVSTAGSFINIFEKNIASYLKVEEAVAVQSGTAGLHLALITSGVEAKDEVIVPTLTFVAAVNPVKYIHGNPVFMDCDDSLTMDPKKLRSFCENECYVSDNILYNKNTKNRVRAIVVVHVFGNIADMEMIMEIAKQYHLKVIEDATEALGTYYIEGIYKGKYAGTIGDIGVYSFNGNKIITTGGGGMIVANKKERLDKCRYLSTQAKDDTLYFNHEEVGFNYRMTNVQAAIGLAQLERLEEFIRIKKENYFEYINLGVSLIPFSKNIRPNYWFYSYITSYRDELLHHLNNKQIQTRPIWKLIHELTPYKDHDSYEIEQANKYHDTVLNLPCSSNLTKDEVKHVVKEIEEFTKLVKNSSY